MSKHPGVVPHVLRIAEVMELFAATQRNPTNAAREAASLLRLQHEVIGELVGAAQAVLSHRVGDLPIRGWLADNDQSRAALHELAAALARAKELEGEK